MTESDPIRVDQVILICQGCKAERLFYPKPILVGAAAIKAWLDAKPTRCQCGATHCDAKMRLVKDETP
jgi:hypothetical protein